MFVNIFGLDALGKFLNPQNQGIFHIFYLWDEVGGTHSIFMSEAWNWISNGLKFKKKEVRIRRSSYQVERSVSKENLFISNRWS